MTMSPQLQTKAKSNPSDSQTVFITDPGIVKTYPRTMTDDEIEFDVHTGIKGEKPEDYYVNRFPLKQLKQAFNAIGSYMGYGQKAMKLFATRPDIALGINKPSSPEEAANVVAQTYKPWSDLWRESHKGFTEKMDQFYAKAPKWASFVPWFVTEFAPSELLEFGTKPSGWLGAYGVEKFGPVLINKTLSKLPEDVRSTLLKEIFKSEEKLTEAFADLGIQPNAKTSEVVKAWRNKALEAHPDRGGNPEDFIKIRESYEKIMQTRGGFWDKLFDAFRSGMEAQPSRGPVGMLANESGGMLIPFNEGDLVKVGSDVAKLIRITGKMATINQAGKIVQVGLEKLKPYEDAEGARREVDLGLMTSATNSPQGAAPTALSSGNTILTGEGSNVNPPSEPPSKGLGDLPDGYEPPEAAVNLERLQATEEAKTTLGKATEAIAEEIQNQTGKKLSHEEVIEKSKEVEILTKGVSRDQTLKFAAELLKTREHMTALAEQQELTPEFLTSLRTVANTGTDIARLLESMKINAMPEYATVKTKIIKKLIEIGKTNEEIQDAAKGVDFTDQDQVATFYRKFVKPKWYEVLDEFAYMNILSSPKTHIVNATSNLIQMAGLNPITRLASGTVDMVGSALTGKERQHYMSEIPQFYKGAINAFPDAFDGLVKALQGKTFIERPDVKHLPTKDIKVEIATLGLGKHVLRALEASDVFFRTLIEGGEMEALAERAGRQGVPLDDKAKVGIEKEAKKRAAYYVFRQPLDPENKSGQGDLLSTIDKLTSAVYRLREVPGASWFIRFVQTPMNILKQGIEYSPAGALTLKGSKDKSEQIGKTIIGSMVFAGASYLAMNGRTTWSLPRGKKDRELFYQAGRIPYAIKIGDQWVSYSKLGPLAYPIAMAAALNYYEKESPNALSDTKIERHLKAMQGIMEFFSDQSYVQGMGDLIKTIQGDKQALSRAVANLPSQFITLSSLQGWINQIIDPIYREAKPGVTLESIWQNAQKKIVGFSQNLPAKKDFRGQPVKKKDRILNAFSPIESRESDESLEKVYSATQKVKQINREEKKLREDGKSLPREDEILRNKIKMELMRSKKGN